MGDFLRRNLFIVLGISLPLALIALVLVVQGIHRWGVEPPTVPVLYVYQADYSLHEHVEFEVVDGSLTARYRYPENDSVGRRLPGSVITLGLFDPRDRSLQRFETTIPRRDGEGASDSVPLELPPALLQLRLDGSRESPDGFHFEVRRRSRGGVFGELFGFGYRGMAFHLVREQVEFDVPGRPVYGTRDAFIAWVDSR